MKAGVLGGIVCIVLCLVMTVSARAVGIEYYIILEDNGDSVVIMNVYGNGTVSIPVQDDVDDVKAKGALYIMDNNTIDIFIGSTQQAAILYKTSLLTNKKGSIWTFEMPLAEGEKNITLAMPENTHIENTRPSALIEEDEFLMLHWDGSMESIRVDYHFSDNDVQGNISEQIDGEDVTAAMEYTILEVVILLSSTAGVFVYITIGKKRRLMKNRMNIIKTLPENEKKIVKTLMENKGEMKRSRLEKVTGIGKSSIALSLRNLERRNIIEVDRTFASHYVKFTRWFNEFR